MSDVPLWTPPPKRAASSNMARFLAGRQGYDELWRWSVEQPEDFWPAVWRFCGIKASRLWQHVTEPVESVRRVSWFPGARLNYTGNLLRYADEEPAIIAWNESGPQRRLTHRQLRHEVARMASALRAAGVEQGDCVAGWMPNVPETVIAILAAASLGAVWASCSPDFGVEGVLDRFGQIEPKVLFAADGVVYAGKPVPTLNRLRQILARLPSVRQTIVLPLGDRHPSLQGIPHCLRWADAVAFHPAEVLRCAELPFEHPLVILFSSGTTGLPKCMVHGAGGTLLQHLKEHVLHCDLKPDDRIFYHTTCGWMMWNWLLSALATGACIVLYDGSPVHPRPDVLWDLASRERISVFGVSAKYLTLMEKQGIRPRETHDLGALKTILSTGSPLLPASFDYVYRDVHPDICLSSISGGTDIVSCFALGNPLAPVYRGQIQARGLGMNVEVWNEDGKPVVGETGELVCHPPFPSMPLRFWNDENEAKYRAAYFEKYPGVWRHGDWARLTPQGGIVISGRSDATLNPGGVRIGTAEIYRQVEKISEALESLVVGHEQDGDVQVILFVKLRAGVELDAELKQRIKDAIREGASPHHVPRQIYAVPDLPRTVSGKITELAVRDILAGREVKNRNSLANPEALDYFARFA